MPFKLTRNTREEKMSLKIIYGKSGTGKSTYIFNEIADKIKNNKRKIYIITPEQFSFTAEKKLLDSISTSSVISAEVLTFNRMAYRVLKETGNSNFSNLSPSGKSMIIYSILSEQKGELKFIGKTTENVELIGTQITEFKKHGITVENLKNTIENTDDKYLKAKLNDMLNVYEKYESQIANQYIDENDNLTLLAERLELVHDFDDSDIYIDEFVGFTHQEYEILRKLLHKAHEVNITVCVDKLDSKNAPDTDVFYMNKITLDRIFNIAKEERVAIEEPIELNKRYRFKNEEIDHLEENIYAFPYKKYENETENIELFLAKNQYSEIEHVAENIVKLVREKNYRYKDISVITKDLEGYANLCKIIFAKYDIPVFIDEKKTLSQNVLVKYILALINIFAKNWSGSSVLEYLKTGLNDGIDNDDIYILENYVLRWGIKSSKWYNGDWNFYKESEEEQNKILHVREKAIEPLLQFKKIISGRKTVREITTAIYEFLICNHIDINFEKKIENLEEIGEIEKAREYETSYKLVMNVLDEIVLVLGDKNVSFEKYAEILKMGLGNTGLGKIPATQDQVTVGDVDRSRSHKVKAVFIIGLNDGMFPSVNNTEGFFNDKDREALKEKGVELAKGTLENLYDDNFNIYKAFSTAEEEVYLSYSSADFEGKSLRASILVNRIKKIFTKLQEESDVTEKDTQIITEENVFEELLNKLREFIDGKEIDEIWFSLYNYYAHNEKWKNRLTSSLKALNYNIETDKVDSSNLEKLYGDTLKTSVSRLEQYKSCPFSYYLKYGLKLSEREEFKIQALDTGTFMHEVIDSFFDKVQENGLDIRKISDDEEAELLDEIINEKLGLKQNYIFTGIPKYVVLANRLKKVVKKSIKYIVESIKCSDFDILGHEMEFKNGKEYPAIQIELENGKKLEITGKIDRIDIAKTPEGNYIRIIDYKSSAKDMNLNEVIAGLQLQLLTYLDAVCNMEDVIPAGILYFNLIDPSIKATKHFDEEKLQDEIRKQFKMKGLILADVNVVKMMDKNLENGTSEVVQAYIDKSGELSNRSNTITREQFEQLQKYTNRIIKQIGNEILSGDIRIKPYYKVKQGQTPCEYCKYKSICNFNTGVYKKEYNYIGNQNKETIFEEIGRELSERFKQ